jgi:murein L,D-transpeptidase YcbB/YkuD
MPCARPVALCALLAVAFSGTALAVEPDDRPWDDPSKTQQPSAQPLTIEDVLARDSAYTSDEDGRGAAPAAAQSGTLDGVIRNRARAPGLRQFDPSLGLPGRAGRPDTQANKDPEPETHGGPAPAVAPAPSPAPAAAPSPAPAAPAAQPAAPATTTTTATGAAPAAAAPTTTAASAPDDKLHLPLKRYFETKASVTLKDFDQGDREALARFYDQHAGVPVFVSKDGFNTAAESVFATFKTAGDWGLGTDDFKAPVLNKAASGAFGEEELADAEIKLALLAMKYARAARGDRIDTPTEQLSSYLDRKPQLVDRGKVLEQLASTSDAGAYLLSLQPKHVQFERLRQKLIALRKSATEEEFEKIPDGPKLTPGKSHPNIALIRKRLKLPPPGIKPDGTAGDDTFYDDALARAIEEFKQKNDLEPVNATITAALRKALNKSERIDERMILANMEEWRWMPEDLGNLYVNVNIPEFMVRVVKNGSVIHAERVVTGKFDTQTPIFSDMMRTIVFQPVWNVPESIKMLELLPSLRAGRNPIEGRGLVMQRNGHDVNIWDIDWERQDIRNFHIYQPPGDANVLGVVKFLFPNKHSVYLHDTPSKSLFNEKVRMFSHGCMRVRNPVQLAEVILAEDKGWDKRKIYQLVNDGPEDNDVALDHPIPVHVTYFTAWVEDNGELKTYPDVYGHEQRIKLGLEGRSSEIVKNRDHLLPPEDAPVARSREDWGDDDRPQPVSRRGGARYSYQEQPQPPPQAYRKKPSGLGNFLNSIFGQ